MSNVYVRSGAAGAGTGADWANAYTTLAAAFTAKAAGDVFYVSDDHAETQASAMTLTSPGTAAAPCFVYCVNHAGTVPPVSADLATTATITTTGANALAIASGVAYFYGITFNAGSGAVNAKLNIASAGAASFFMFNSCTLAKLGTTGIAAAVGFGPSSTSALSVGVALVNTKVQFGATADTMSVGYCDFVWKNTASAISGAAFPTSLFSGALPGTIQLEAVDLSALGSGKTIVGATSAPKHISLKDCKLGASVTIAATPTAFVTETVVSRIDSSGTNYIEQKYTYAGTQTDETTIIRTSGASDGTTAKSRKIVTTANSKWQFPFEATPIAIWQDSTSAATATLEGVWNAAALPNNDEIWFDLEYLGAAGNPQGSFATGTKADGLASGSALTASTQAWDTLVTARANTTAYSLGDVIKVATNPGRIFFCTTAGTTAGSEPGGYASAVDGGSVTDSGAVFRAGVRFKKAVSFTAAQKGVVYAYVKAAKVSSTFYIDPLIVLA
jgi:hypothetical protein